MFNMKQASASYAHTKCAKCGKTALRAAKGVKAATAVCKEYACGGLLLIVRIEGKLEREARFARMCQVNPNSEAYLSQ